MGFYLPVALVWVLVDPNSSPHVCTASALPIEPSLESQETFFFFLVSYIKQIQSRTLNLASGFLEKPMPPKPGPRGLEEVLIWFPSLPTKWHCYLGMYRPILAPWLFQGCLYPACSLEPPRGASDKTTRLESEPECQKPASKFDLHSAC